MKNKLERASLWTAAIVMGSIVLDMRNDRTVDLLSAVVTGLIVGGIVFVWSVISEKIQDAKMKKLVKKITEEKKEKEKKDE